MQALISWTMRSWPELKSRVGCLTNWATRAPPKNKTLKKKLANVPYRYLFLSFLFKWERARWRRGAEGEKENPKVLAQHGAHRRDQFHNPGITTHAKIKSWTLNRLSHPAAPDLFLLKPTGQLHKDLEGVQSLAPVGFSLSLLKEWWVRISDHRDEGHFFLSLTFWSWELKQYWKITA